MLPMSYNSNYRIVQTSDYVMIMAEMVKDAEVYGRPWTAEVPMRRLPAGSHIYEYACHECNYAIVGALSGARWQEHYEAQESADRGEDN